MSNFTIFDQNYVEKLINPFNFHINPGMVPIKYEALTPDIFLFLFRNTDDKGVGRYYIAIEFDYIQDTKELERIINNWYGKIVKYLPLYCRSVSDDPDLQTISAQSTCPYYVVMAEVEPPGPGSGFWSDNIVINIGDDIKDKISHFTKKEQANIRKGLNSILKHKNITKKLLRDNPDIKNEISFYRNEGGGIEFFYNQDNFNSKHTEVDDICQKIEDIIKKDYAESIQDLAWLIDSCLVVVDDIDEYYKQYPPLKKIADLCGEIETIDSKIEHKKLLDEIKIQITLLRNTLNKEST